MNVMACAVPGWNSRPLFGMAASGTILSVGGASSGDPSVVVKAAVAPPTNSYEIPRPVLHQQSQRFGGRFTRTVNEQVATSPQVLVAVQMTTVEPSGKAVPEGGVQMTGPLLPDAPTLK